MFITAYAAASSVEKHILSVAQCKRELKRGADSFLVVVNSVDYDVSDVTPPSAAHTALSTGLDAVKQDYADIFNEPAGLPPDRGIEHVIPLEESSQPQFKRMYRLSPAELVEVKRQGELSMVIDY